MCIRDRLNVQGEGVDVIIKPESQWLDHMNDFVRDMHTTSGLLAELDKGLTMTQAQDQVLDYIRTYVPQAGKAPLAGNTIGTDRSFLVKDMPKLESYVHYRNVDVSSIKELARRWYPRAFGHSPQKQGNHRALADIQESIEELMYWREVIMVPSPGPETTRCDEIAAKYQGFLTGAGRD